VGVPVTASYYWCDKVVVLVYIQDKTSGNGSVAGPGSESRVGCYRYEVGDLKD
jgi:hypothetical protein